MYLIQQYKLRLKQTKSEVYTSEYFDALGIEPLLDYSWKNTKNIRKIDIDLTCEEYGFKGRGCIGILTENGLPVEQLEILSKMLKLMVRFIPYLQI